MIPYRIKHVPTGLYFMPSKNASNLSKRGKVYLTKTNVLGLYSDYIPICIEEDSRFFENFKECIPLEECQYSKGRWKYYAPKTDFVVEEFSTSEQIEAAVKAERASIFISIYNILQKDEYKVISDKLMQDIRKEFKL